MWYKDPKILSIIILSIIIIVLLLCFCGNTTEKYSFTFQELTLEDKKNIFANFRTMYDIVFPNGKSRNSGGFAFFKHLVDLDMPANKFAAYNQMYCGVSGAIVAPDRKDRQGNLIKNFDYIKIKDMNNNPVWGKYYRCCDPCCADLMREDKGTPNTRVETYTHTHKEEKTDFKVLTIANPCPGYLALDNSPENMEFKQSFNCLECGQDGRATNGIYTENGRLIVAVLFPVEGVPEAEMEKDYEMVVNNKHKSRMKQEYSKVRGGMGDIFIRVSILGK